MLPLFVVIDNSEIDFLNFQENMFLMKILAKLDLLRLRFSSLYPVVWDAAPSLERMHVPERAALSVHLHLRTISKLDKHQKKCRKAPETLTAQQLTNPLRMSPRSHRCRQ